MNTDLLQTGSSEWPIEALDAARTGDVEKLAAFLRAGLPVDAMDGKENTLLMLACCGGHFAAARLLLERGADTEKRNDRDQTPIAVAAMKGNLPIVRLLTGFGADVSAVQSAGRLPVDFAAWFGHTEVVRYLESVARSGKSVGLLALSGLIGSIRSMIGSLHGKSFFFVAGG